MSKSQSMMYQELAKSMPFFKKLSSGQLFTQEATSYFQQHPTHLMRMYELLEKKDPSIRLIEYFLSHYVHEHNVFYSIPSRTTPLFVKDAYQQYMLQNHKIFFDPCKRVDKHKQSEKMTVPLPDGRPFETTVGQLLFFKWFLEDRVLDYLEAHREEIEAEFRAFTRQKQEQTSVFHDLFTTESAKPVSRKRKATGDHLRRNCIVSCSD